MFFKLLILSVILVALIMLALGIKMLFNPKAEFSGHACAFDSGEKEIDIGCVKCQLKDIVDCPEKDNRTEN